MKLLERWDAASINIFCIADITESEIRRALAIAQALDEVDNTGDYAVVLWHRDDLLRRADELLRGEE